jgi:hypothetical protein
MRATSAFRCASAREYAARVSARPGQSAATTWSRWARRAAGAPLTSSSRSGRNTLTSGRASAVARLSTGLPSTRMCFASPGWKPTSMRCPPSAPASSTTTLATPSPPRRTSSRSFEVRGERAVQPK